MSTDVKKKRRSVAKGTKRFGKFTSPEKLNDSIRYNVTLAFARESPHYPTVEALQKKQIARIIEQFLPEGCRSVIAAGKKREKISKRTFENLFANICLTRFKGKTTMSISLSPNTYSHTAISGSGLLNLVKIYEHYNLLTLTKGFRVASNPSKSRLSRIEMRPKFWSLLGQDTAEILGGSIIEIPIDEDCIIFEPFDLIQLRKTVVKKQSYINKSGQQHTRSRKVKRIVPRKQWSKEITKEEQENLHNIRGGLLWFNLVLSDYEITYTKTADPKIHRLYPRLYAVYTDNFQQGGRLYTGKGGHQGLSKKERSTIRYNGHKTVELDFNGLHIRMLYHIVGVDYPLDADPYGEVLKAIGKNPDKIFKQFPEIRGDLKTTLFSIINGKIKKKEKRHKQVIAQVRHRLFEEWKQKHSPGTRKKCRIECIQRLRRWEKAGLTIPEVIKGFYKAHKRISHTFYTGCGLRLQKIDAQIAFYILFNMMVSYEDNCIPTLSVHDSFITFDGYQNKLESTMKTIYQDVMQQVTNSEKSFKIPVKFSKKYH